MLPMQQFIKEQSCPTLKRQQKRISSFVNFGHDVCKTPINLWKISKTSTHNCFLSLKVRHLLLFFLSTNRLISVFTNNKHSNRITSSNHSLYSITYIICIPSMTAKTIHPNSAHLELYMRLMQALFQISQLIVNNHIPNHSVHMFYIQLDHH